MKAPFLVLLLSLGACGHWARSTPQARPFGEAREACEREVPETRRRQASNPNLAGMVMVDLLTSCMARNGWTWVE